MVFNIYCFFILDATLIFYAIYLACYMLIKRIPGNLSLCLMNKRLMSHEFGLVYSSYTEDNSMFIATAFDCVVILYLCICSLITTIFYIHAVVATSFGSIMISMCMLFAAMFLFLGKELRMCTSSESFYVPQNFLLKDLVLHCTGLFMMAYSAIHILLGALVLIIVFIKYLIF